MPGAGKTVLAVELMMALLQHRSNDDPVPVRLPASSWNPVAEESQGNGVACCAADGTVASRPPKGGIPSLASFGVGLVAAGRVLPVVDGLDELDVTDLPGYGSRASQAVRMFNDYQRHRSKAGLIVTCRRGHYQALTDDRIWIQDAAHVEIGPVGLAQVRQFITACTVDVGRWKKVLDTVKHERYGLLARGLTTPWRLTLVVVVYDERGSRGEFLRDPQELTQTALDAPDAIRDHLLGLLIPAALRSVPAQTFDPVRACVWLTVLARYLNNNARIGRSLGGCCQAPISCCTPSGSEDCFGRGTRPRTGLRTNR